MGPQGWSLVEARAVIDSQPTQTLVPEQGFQHVGPVVLELEQILHGHLQQERHQCHHHCQAVGT